MCGCSQMTTTTMELPSLVCLCVLISCGVSSADANERVKVVVMEEDDVILLCSLSTKENIESKLFDWQRDGQKEVFMYDKGEHYNNKPSDRQDRQFRGRVFHFQDELKHGNASIIIRNTTVTDSGNYTCDFPRLKPSQTFHIELVVGAAPDPSIEIIDQTNDWSLLQCAVRGAFPEPKVEWKDSSGNIVPAEDPQVTKRGDKYDVILQTTVTKTDRYHCEATQKEIHHQIDSKTFVRFGERVKVVVKEDSDAILPCSLSTKEDIESNLFDWKKDGRKEVFLYNAGHHYNNGFSDSQDRQFKGRVFHFQDELKHGVASIIIRDTTMADSGNYTCYFPRQSSQTFHIELVVEETSSTLIIGIVVGIIGVVLGVGGIVFGLLKAKSANSSNKGNRNNGTECKRLSAMT